MKKFYKILFLSCVLFAYGCSKDTTPKPAPLVDFQQQLNVKNSWSHNIGSNIGEDYVKLNPAFSGDKIFVPDYRGTITALNRNTGKVLWKTKTKVTITSSLAANSNLVFAGTGAGEILALDQNNGQIKWSAPLTNEVLATPLALDDKVIVKTTNGQLTAFATANGVPMWKFTHEEPALVLRGSSSPKVSGNLIICGFANGEIVALNQDTGNVAWRQPIAEPNGSFAVERMVDIVADPVIKDGVIYTATYQGKIAALNLKSGAGLWTNTISTFSGLDVTNNLIIASDAYDNVSAFDRSNGDLVWQQKALANRGVTAPAVISHYVAVGDNEGYLHLMNTVNGHFVARIHVGGGGIIAQPIVDGNAIYVVTKSGSLAKYVLW